MGKGERKKRAAGKIKIKKQKAKKLKAESSAAINSSAAIKSTAAIIATQYVCGAYDHRSFAM
jgi:hypothetical protein